MKSSGCGRVGGPPMHTKLRMGGPPAGQGAIAALSSPHLSLRPVMRHMRVYPVAKHHLHLAS